MRSCCSKRLMLASAAAFVGMSAKVGAIDSGSLGDSVGVASSACLKALAGCYSQKRHPWLLAEQGLEATVLDGRSCGSVVVLSGGASMDVSSIRRCLAYGEGGIHVSGPKEVTVPHEIVMASNVVPDNEAAADGTRETTSEGEGESVSPPPPSPPSSASSLPCPETNEVAFGGSHGAASLLPPSPLSSTPPPPSSAKSPPPSSREPETVTFVPGLRLQGRYLYDNETDQYGFFLRRLRLKGKGNIFGLAKYGIEIKIDNVFRTATDTKVEPENAWVEFPVHSNFALRAGLFDVPVTRNVLTSDSRQLLMDRTLISGALTNVGMADNTVGVLGHGRPFGGHLEYAAGLFNNLQFKKFGTSAATKQSNHLMPAGRIVFNLLDPAPRGGYADYESSYLGQGRRLSIGANSAYLPRAQENPHEFALYAWGADLFFNTAGFTLEAEYDRFRESMRRATPDIKGDGWYVQAGYLVRRRIEFTGRHQELDLDGAVSDKRLRWTSVGLNIYIRGHSLKLQTDYTFKWGQGNDVTKDMFQTQLQLDF